MMIIGLQLEWVKNRPGYPEQFSALHYMYN